MERSGDPLASEEEVAEVEEYVKGNVDAIVGDVDRMKLESATAATSQLGSQVVELRKQLSEEQAKRVELMKEGRTSSSTTFGSGSALLSRSSGQSSSTRPAATSYPSPLLRPSPLILRRRRRAIRHSVGSSRSSNSTTATGHIGLTLSPAQSRSRTARHRSPSRRSWFRPNPNRRSWTGWPCGSTSGSGPVTTKPPKLRRLCLSASKRHWLCLAGWV